MIINVKVFPKAKKESVLKWGLGYKVYLTAAAEEGKANKALAGILSNFFGIRRSQVKILKGLKSRDKLVSVDA